MQWENIHSNASKDIALGVADVAPISEPVGILQWLAQLARTCLKQALIARTDLPTYTLRHTIVIL